MANRRIQHEHAMRLGLVLLEIVAPCLREDERREAFGLFVDAARACLERYEDEVQRTQHRLGKSSRN